MTILDNGLFNKITDEETRKILNDLTNKKLEDTANKLNIITEAKERGEIAIENLLKHKGIKTVMVYWQ